MRIESAGLSDTGLKRTLNEDSFALDEKSGIFVLADGMGGHAAGEVASAMLRDTVMEYMRNKVNGGIKDKDLPGLIQEALDSANLKIFTLSSGDRNKKKMGTTAVAALILDKTLHAAWVGDSRLYLLRDGILKRLSRDHSRVQELIDGGVISESAAATHPERNIITRAVGTGPMVSADTLSIKMKEGDMFVLCSDGIHGEMSENDMREISSSKNSSEEICGMLIDKANKNGGNDNSTAIVIKIFK